MIGGSSPATLTVSPMTWGTTIDGPYVLPTLGPTTPKTLNNRDYAVVSAQFGGKVKLTVDKHRVGSDHLPVIIDF